MKKLLQTALLFFCVACVAFTRNSPPPASSSFRPMAVLPDTTDLSNTDNPSDIPPADTTAPIVTTIVLPPAASPGHPSTPATASPAHPAPATPGPPSAPPRPVTLRVLLRDLTLKPSGLLLEWELQVNGKPKQKGTFSNFVFGPQHTAIVHLPVRPPTGDGDETFLQVRYRLRQPASPATSPTTRQPAASPKQTPSPGNRPITVNAPAGPVIAEEQLLLKPRTGSELTVRPAGELSFTDTNDIFTIQSPSIHLEFNKQTGWLQRYEVKGTVLLHDSAVLRSLFLPAADENPASHSPTAAGAASLARSAADTAAHLPDSTDPWQEANRDPHLQLFSTSTGSEMVIVRAEYTLPATSCLLHLSYTVNAVGEILVAQSMESDSTQKGWPLPCFGMQWPLPAGFDSSAYDGLETPQPGSPDSSRKTTAWIGIYRQLLNAPSSYPPVTADTHPSPITGTRPPLVATAARWWTITGPKGNGLLITADSSLVNGNTGKGSPLLLNIFYRQPPADDSSGNTPGLSFHLPYANYRYAFKITPLTPDHP